MEKIEHLNKILKWKSISGDIEAIIIDNKLSGFRAYAGTCAIIDTPNLEFLKDVKTAITELLNELSQDILEDGFGSQWSKICPLCHKESMQVVRPGEVQCVYCE